ncbi:hypothetical protein [Acinetobacter seifertii]|uniref:hypothetical protein n=1 Tax=Acinetobacter seifertii TaxID=1530123 RepID=UPI0019061EC8|nr:hypothetical protein [Acinetobacter seifertii]MBJ9425406.1 hypothetical protein [Acinetobacter seifertii]
MNKFDLQIKEKKNLVLSYKVFYRIENTIEIHNLDIDTNGLYFLDGHDLRKFFIKNILEKEGVQSIKLLKHERYGFCLLCSEFKLLKRSHVIGATVFRKLLRATSSNSAISFSIKKNEIKLCNDNWTEYLLCDSCEGVFNTKYENYAINLLRGKLDSVTTEKKDDHIKLNNINSRKVALYILSLYWRGALSIAPAYNQLLITNGFYEYLKKCFLGVCELNFNIFKFKISKLIDETNQTSDDKLEYMIINPFVKLINDVTVYSFVFEGFLLELIIDGKNKIKAENYLGFISDNFSYLKIPYVEFTSIPEIYEVLSKSVNLARNDEKIYLRCIQELANYENNL